MGAFEVSSRKTGKRTRGSLLHQKVHVSYLGRMGAWQVGRMDASERNAKTRRLKGDI